MKVNPISAIGSSCRSLCFLIQSVAVVTLWLNASLVANADTRIRGEFEYSVDDNELKEWEIGPTFFLQELDNSELSLEVPIGQDDSVWFIQPELIYEAELNDLKLEFSVGIEAPLNGEAAEGFGSIEGSVDF